MTVIPKCVHHSPLVALLSRWFFSLFSFLSSLSSGLCRVPFSLLFSYFTFLLILPRIPHIPPVSLLLVLPVLYLSSASSMEYGP